ncbi:hypothetical protein [Aeoliella sp. SH292]|uniref:hypothetical protein n=1 Tax=Aeoliella sp. SH292 TaxID=3454464 RepID=UPI003F9B5EB4
MSHQTVEASSFEEYLASDDDSLEDRAAQEVDRNERLSRFPYSVMLKVAFPERDFANRWCWQHFGPCDGECTQQYSEYRACHRNESHSHVGNWTSHWFVKTDYNFGFSEWYFAESVDRDRFVANVDSVNWGEHFPK